MGNLKKGLMDPENLSEMGELEAEVPSTSPGQLRDAAVDPVAGDFLEPVNAGVGRPEAPWQVNPEIHGVEDVRLISPDDRTQEVTRATLEAQAVASLNATMPARPAPPVISS